jgi:16S rRNA (cytosine967-C5)-methyltransferase
VSASRHSRDERAGRAGKGALHLRRAGHDPRAAALNALSRVLSSPVDSQAALRQVLSSPSLMPTDKRLCTELVYGVLRRHLALEDFLKKFLRRPDGLPAEMRLTLLVALYEMVCLRIPQHASVAWAVAHVRNRFGPGLAAVANGTLRAMQRAPEEFARPRPGASEEESLSLRFAMPRWIVRLWLQGYGSQGARALLEAAGQPPPAGLRMNRACPDWEQLLRELTRGADPVDCRTADPAGAPLPRAPASSSREEFAAAGELPAAPGRDGEKVFLAGPHVLAFSGSLPRHALPLLEQGKASRQSAASCEALEAFAPGSWPLPIWDCCAGRGGKTLALLEQGIAVALASDPAERRLRALPEEYRRLGLTHPPCPALAVASVEDVLAGEDPCSRLFGTILADAPCSGLGTLSRRPEIRLRRTPEDLTALAERQKRILSLVWPRLKPGGSLVYLTCTLNPAENERQIAAFLADHADATLCGEFHTDVFSPLREFFYGARVEKTPQPGAVWTNASVCGMLQGDAHFPSAAAAAKGQAKEVPMSDEAARRTLPGAGNADGMPRAGTPPFHAYPSAPMELFDPEKHLPPAWRALAGTGGAVPPLRAAARAHPKLLLIPRAEDCRALWDQYAMLENIRVHSALVADMAYAVGLLARERGIEVSGDALLAAGLLHDLGKTYTIAHGGSHAQLGASWVMRETRNGPIAQAVLFHVHWHWPEHWLEDERLLLTAITLYADKRVKHDAFVTLDERFEDLHVRYGIHAGADERITASHEQSKRIEAALSRRLGLELHEYIADSGRLVKRA